MSPSDPSRVDEVAVFVNDDRQWDAVVKVVAEASKHARHITIMIGADGLHMPELGVHGGCDITIVGASKTEQLTKLSVGPPTRRLS